MNFYEVKVNYTRQTSEGNPAIVKETYLVEAINCSEAEQRVINEIKPYIFGGDVEVPSCKKRHIFDLFQQEGKELWFEAKVELVTVDVDKETRKAVKMLVQDNTISNALEELKFRLGGIDGEIIAIAKSPIIDVYRSIA